MRLLYTSTLCVSSERSPTCGQILPILNKLEVHFKVAEEDTAFTSAVKEKVWGDLKKRYQVFSISIQSLSLQRKRANHTIFDTK